MSDNVLEMTEVDLVAEIVEEAGEVWEQLPTESSPAYALFLVYLRLGHRRSARETARIVNEAAEQPYSNSYIQTLASKWRWNDRSRAFDKALLAEQREEFAAELAEARQTAVKSIVQITKNVSAIAQGKRPRDDEGNPIELEVRPQDMLKAADMIRDVVGLREPDRKEITIQGAHQEQAAVDYGNLSVAELQALRELTRKLKGIAEVKVIDVEHEKIENKEGE